MNHDAALPRDGRAAARLGHHANEILVGAIVAATALGLYPPPAQYAIGIALLLASTVIGAWLLMRRHDRQLCETCVLAMPLNPSQDAQRYARRFWMAHTGSEPRFLVPYLAVLVGSNFAGGSLPGKAFWAVMQLSMIWLILSQSTHRRLQPWCPWCSGGGGGQDVDDLPPVIPHDDRLPA